MRCVYICELPIIYIMAHVLDTGLPEKKVRLYRLHLETNRREKVCCCKRP